MHIFYMQISAILSDYDGTLCPTGSIKNQEENLIPADLEDILWNISKRIPICIVSSKDFGFLHAKTKFATIISCIMGIETIALKRHKQEEKIARNNDGFKCQNNLKCIESIRLLSDKKILEVNSSLLASIADHISQNFELVTIEQKLTADRRILAGVTIDWRHIKDWRSFKLESEPRLRKMISEKQRELSIDGNGGKLHIQTYTTHPFIDIYATKCDKGIAFDYVYPEILKMQGKQEQQQNILYLGDSENDNPAFKKADISIGVHSDTRLRPKLDCKYNVCFDKLSAFLKGLLEKDLQFSDNLVTLP
jgi:HAD superfamily hydrolase (TIGR01484 family)